MRSGILRDLYVPASTLQRLWYEDSCYLSSQDDGRRTYYFGREASPAFLDDTAIPRATAFGPYPPRKPPRPLNANDPALLARQGDERAARALRAVLGGSRFTEGLLLQRMVDARRRTYIPGHWPGQWFVRLPQMARNATHVWNASSMSEASDVDALVEFPRANEVLTMRGGARWRVADVTLCAGRAATGSVQLDKM